MKKIYKKIAKAHGVSARQVKRDIDYAIKEAYKNPTASALSVPRKADIPTADEFIDHCIKEIKVF